MAAELPLLAFSNAAEWGAWLAANHGSSAGVWLKFARHAKRTGAMTYADALSEALAWGWIDGQNKRLDAAWWMQKFTPRRTRSIWSKVNRENVMALLAAGRMQRPGLLEVERAKADGRWEAAYDPASRATVPDDLAAALEAHARAAELFVSLDAKNRYAILFRIQAAKKAATRASRIATFVEMLARGEKLHP